MKKSVSLLLVLALVFAMVCAFAVNASAEEESAEETSAEEEAKVIDPNEDGNIIIFDAGNYILKNGEYSVGCFLAASSDCVLTIPKDTVVTVTGNFTNFGTLYVYGTLIVNSTDALISGTIHVYGTLSANSTNIDNTGAIRVYCDGKFEGTIKGKEVVQDGHDFDAYGFCKNCGKPDGTILSGDVWYKLTENDTELPNGDTGLTLTIGGEGEMPDFMFATDRPWHNDAGNITAVEINSGVTSIGSNAFVSCGSMTELTISEGVTSIGPEAFSGCGRIETLTIPGSVERIGNQAFADCSGIATLTISEGVTSIEMGAFKGCGSLQKVTIPNTVTSIGEGAFSLCDNLKEVTIPASVTSIGGEAFDGCPNLVIHGTSKSAAEQYAKDYGVDFFVDGECKHVGHLVCETCQAHLTGSQLLQAWEGDDLSGSTISGGNLAIIVGIAALVIGLGGGFLLGRKKRKPAVAGVNNEKTSTT